MRRWLAVVACSLVPAAVAARKKPVPETPAPAAAPAPAAGGASIAVFRVEPLGLDVERAARLEALFRLELERVAGVALPQKAQVEKAVASDAALRGCTGEAECMKGIGRKLGVKQLVTGNVGELGDSYVLNLKLVDVDTGAEVRRISEPLRGNPDELIEAMRVAAYRLVAPEKLKGAIEILSDVAGAEVFLDGKKLGVTPFDKPAGNLMVGPHQLRLTAKGYTDFFLKDIEVRFQKSTQIEVRMVRAKDPGPAPIGDGKSRPAPVPWYSTTWGYVAIGAGAVLCGVLIGYALSDDGVVDCSEDPGACGL